eukprot:TRINITY_DN3137_c0_g1_i5.p1 TRINITY_DN3137_c0_g1~~TRINITY_DN3137_c0_g1_i5.p1  ORF type:complete len:299 (+),score=66.16 TRINITY_DN3137_c0_g1_i5:88-897(+)
MDKPLLIEEDKNVATITFNRPSRGNSITPSMFRELDEALVAFKARTDIRVIVITAKGQYFCTGMDLSEANQNAMQRAKTGGLDAAKVYETLRTYPKPIVSRINGPALAGGWGLLFTTDIRVAIKTAWFQFTETSRGIVPAIISAYVAPSLGAFHAKQLFLTCEKISAQRAYEIGFLSAVAEDERDLDEKTAQYVDLLLAAGPQAMSVVKDALRHHVDHSHTENLEFVRNLFSSGLVTSSDEARYGIMCFVQRKKPDWSEFYRKKSLAKL